MSDRINVPGEDTSERRTVTDGFFEREVYLSREEVVAFLRDLADQLESDTQFTISSETWEIPFEYADPIELEIEFSDHHHKELELELEFEAPSEGPSIGVN